MHGITAPEKGHGLLVVGWRWPGKSMLTWLALGRGRARGCGRGWNGSWHGPLASQGASRQGLQCLVSYGVPLQVWRKPVRLEHGLLVRRLGWWRLSREHPALRRFGMRVYLCPWPGCAGREG